MLPRLTPVKPPKKSGMETAAVPGGEGLFISLHALLEICQEFLTEQKVEWEV